jgi:hypothetical protein
MGRRLELVRRTQIVLEDDLNGGPAEETLTFGVEGTWYEIDLNSKNADTLRQVLSTYVSAGRRMGQVAGQERPRVRATSNTKVVRDWASAQGLPVPSRGRLPRAVIEAFDSARQSSG